jgi:hypothetical protein
MDLAADESAWLAVSRKVDAADICDKIDTILAYVASSPASHGVQV